MIRRAGERVNTRLRRARPPARHGRFLAQARQLSSAPSPAGNRTLTYPFDGSRT
jgi:hypothetical protein